jgi:hypothetical protein
MPEPSPQKPEEKPEKSPWNIKLAEIIIQAVAGGSIGTFATLLSSSELPKLALGGVIGGGVAPIVFAVAEPISKRLRQGAGYVGEAAASSGEVAAQKWWTGLSGFERKYLQALQAYCYDLEVEGFRGNLPPLALEDVYIPLQLATDRGYVYGQARVDTTIWNFLPQSDAEKADSTQNQRLAIVADPGYGKTTLTRYLALSFSCPTYEAKGAIKLLPILLRFRDIHKQVQSETEPQLEALIVQVIKGLPTCSELQITVPWMKQQLKDGKCLVMLDGLDEVPEERRETLSRWAKRQMQEHNSFFILTSRPHGYDASLIQGVRQLKILDFTNDQKRDFLNKWYRVERWRNHWEILLKDNQKQPESQRLTEEQAKAQSDAEAQQAADDLYRQIVGNLAINQQLAVNPLLLTIIAATHNAFDILPERRASLYRKTFNLLLEDRPNRRDTRLKLKESAQNQAVLQALAFRLSQQGETQFTRKQGADWIQSRLAEQCGENECTPRQFLKDIEQIAGLLTGGDSDLYQFAHKTFQEYLTAVEIQSQGLQPLLDRLQAPDWQMVEDWREIFSFYAAIEGADWLVEAVAEMPEGENRQRSLLLLYQIVKEEKSQIKQPKLRQRFDDLFNELSVVFLKKDEILQAAQAVRVIDAKFVLERRFLKGLLPLDNGSQITANPITWREYQQLLEDQNAGQFHSTAEPQTILPNQLDQPVTGISEADRRWFCAWLSTQTGLQVDGSLFDYDLPTSEQYREAGIKEDDRLYVVRRPIDLKYDKLMNYLASATWKEADKETYRLMITTVGKEEGQYFGTEELRNFPCEELKAIDSLWVKYSNGHFGFSVQKKIYVDCGAKLDGNYPGKEIWEKFGDRVGWRANGEWLTYNDLNPSLSSRQGIFPWVRAGGVGRVWGGSLLSHRDL